MKHIVGFSKQRPAYASDLQEVLCDTAVLVADKLESKNGRIPGLDVIEEKCDPLGGTTP